MSLITMGSVRAATCKPSHGRGRVHCTRAVPCTVRLRLVGAGVGWWCSMMGVSRIVRHRDKEREQLDGRGAKGLTARRDRLDAPVGACRSLRVKFLCAATPQRQVHAPLGCGDWRQVLNFNPSGIIPTSKSGMISPETPQILPGSEIEFQYVA